MPDKSPEWTEGAGREDPRPSAVALSLGAAGQAPTVVAKGYGAVADAIVERAKDSGLYVHASSELVKLLMHVDLDSRIPPNLYVAVAEMLTWLQELEVDKNSA
ncbi:EscU/YscU/HrcU family type III secretion system export apparatus switch protein [Polaromonas sp. YR568]|uniref:EscU/YscU/HrcU family type III secretion system export apparatus switch protein n=1 Tax=Polaromonas sp. YR568 TaxID=1855301 RepID=UPI00398BF2A7